MNNTNANEATVAVNELEVREAGTEAEAMDDYGRTEAERTVTLTSVQAEQINDEVGQGDHGSYEDALEYVVQRGLAEIHRARASQAKSVEARKASKAKDEFNKYLALDPSVASDPVKLMKLMQHCGLVPSGK